MKISTRGRYAVMAMVELSKQCEGDLTRPIPLSQLSDAQDISLAYLEQLFVSLRRSGLVESVRGKNGGYRLTSAPEDMVIGSIIFAVDETVDVTRCKSADGCMKNNTRCQTHDLWSRLGDHIRSFFDGITLADVAAGFPVDSVAGTDMDDQSSANASSETQAMGQPDAARTLRGAVQ
jgi:Rrf2 family iron-sulfur cluster assembly transcriptional regulator